MTTFYVSFATGVEPIDAHFSKLNCEMKVLDKKCNEFEVIEKYVQNTHAATHNLFSLQLEEVFKIERKGENSR